MLPPLKSIALTTFVALALATTTGGGSPASASELEVEGPVEPLPPDISADFADLQGRIAFHLLTRWTLGDRDSVWTVELAPAIRLTEGLALTLKLPFAFDDPREGETRELKFLFGNMSVGLTGGGLIRLVDDYTKVGAPALRIGGALDIYAPTRPELDPDAACLSAPLACDPSVNALRTRPQDPGLYLAGAMSFRARAAIGFSASIFAAQAEIGLTPAFTLEVASETFLILNYGIRARVVPIREIEPFIELYGASAVKEPSNRYPLVPVTLTPGVRFHVGGVSPAVMVSLAFGDNRLALATVAIDFAGAQERMIRASAERDPLDF